MTTIEFVMHAKILCSWLICLGFVVPTAAQGTRMVFGAQETRVFESDECSFTLPGKDWEWGDPPSIEAKGAKGLVSATSKSGLAFALIVSYVNYELESSEYANFQGGVLSAFGMKKLRSESISFKGVSGYQLEIEQPEGNRGGVIRELFANDRAYCLVVHSPGGSQPRKEAEAVFNKFEFRGTPRPMKLPPEPEDDGTNASARASGWALSHTFIVIGMMVGLIFGIWWLFHTKENG